jgi:RHS repeat-associated protein
VVPQSVAIASPDVCATAWVNMTGNQPTSATSFALSNMVTATCYRIAVRSFDNAGNHSGYAYSNPILVDTTTPGGAPGGGPFVTDNCDTLGSCARSGDTIYFRPAAAGTVTLSSTGTDDESAIASSTYGTLSPATGWTYSSGTVSGDPATKNLTWSGSAVAATLTVRTTNGAGLISPATTITLTPDTSAPVGDFTTPGEGALVMQSGTSYTVAWTETASPTVVASRSLQRQKGPVVTAGTCTGVTWGNDGSPTTSASPLSVTGLVNGYCYRWQLTVTDNIGNYNNTPYTSGSVLIDTSPPSLPDVTASGSPVYQPGTNGTVYFRPTTGGSMTLTATESPIPASGINCIKFQNLTPSSGWTPNPTLPACDTTSPYTETLGFGSSSGAATIEVLVQDGTGTWSAVRTITLTPYTGSPIGDFTTPGEGALVMQSGTSYTVAWTETASPTVVASRSLQRQKGPVVTAGTCTGVTWGNDGSPTTSASPLSVTGLVNGYCYRWQLTVTDNIGNYNNTPYTSGSVLIDTSPPSLPDVTASGSPVYQPGTNGTVYFRPTTGGSMTLTATESPIPASGINCIKFQNLTPSSGWTPNPTLPACDTTSPYTETLGFGSSSGAATIEVLVQDGTGTWSAVRTITLTPYTGSPIGDFTTPGEGALVMQSGTSYTVAWTETASPTVVASRSLQRQKGPVVTAGTCTGVTWGNDGSPTTSASPLSVTGLVNGYCYRWQLTVTDNIGNYNNTPYTSGSVLIDTSPPSLPDVTASGSPVYQPGTNGTVYFRPTTGGSMTLTATESPIPASGINCIKFQNLTPSSGWTPNPTLPACDTTSPYTETLGFGSSSGAATIEVLVQDGTGTWSAVRTITLTPYTGSPIGDFTTPGEGALVMQSGTSYTVAWTETASPTVVASRSLQRQKGPVVTAGTCTGVTWGNDGSPTTSASPLSVTGLVNGYCYRWQLTVTDNIGNYNNTPYTSGSVLIDTSPPSLPDVTASGSPVYQPGTNGTVYFRPTTGGSMTLTATESPIPASGINCIKFQNLTPSSGWTPNPTLPACDTTSPYTETLGFGSSSGAATIEVLVQDGTGTWSAVRTITLTPYTGSPIGDFTTPGEGALVMQSGTSYTVAWTETASPTVVASRSLQRQKGPVVTAGTCTGVTWGNDGSPTTSASPLSVTGLVNGYCYRWQLTVTDNIGNYNNTPYTSGSVLIDTSPPSLPDVTASGSPVYQPGTNGTVYFRPTTGGSMTLTATESPIPASGINCIKFQNLTPSSGWTPNPTLPACDTTSPYTETLGFGSSSGAATIEVLVQDGTGTWSAVRTITLTPDNGSSIGADFSAPNESAQLLMNSTSNSVTWSEADPASGIASRSLQRQRLAASGGTCTGNWQNDGSPTSTASPQATTLSDGYCYQWIVTLTDHVGNARSFTSGRVLVDTSPPSADITAPETGQPLAGTVIVTGSASDLNFSGYVLDYGAGSAPDAWTTIVTSASPVTTGTLGTWVTGSLTGVYTLRLTATDIANNTSVVTNAIYLDNTDRGHEPYYTSVPFDLGSGWNLGVNVATGEASLSRGLFSIPSWGPGQSLSLAYNSADPSTAGLFGTGWSSNLTQYLSFESGFVVWHGADGGRVPFGQVQNAWTALAGHYEILTQPSGGGYKITETDGSSLSFDSSGHLSALTDRYGVSLAIVWGSSATDATSTHSTTFTTDSSHQRITSLTDSANRSWSYAYSANGSQLTGITDSAGNLTTLAYDAFGRLTSISRGLTPYGGSQAPVVWSIAYDQTSGMVTSVTDPTGGTENASTFTYDSGYAAGTTTVVRPRDATGITPPATTGYSLDDSGRGWVSSMVEYASAVDDPDPVSWTTYFAYDADGNLTNASHQIDAASPYATGSSTYDAWGDVATQTDPAGITTSYTYSTDAFHDLILKVVSASDSERTLSQARAYAYDSLHRLCREVANPSVDPSTITCTSTLPGGAADQNLDTRYAYDTHNQMTSQTDPAGIVTAYTYSDSGNQTAVTRNYVASGPVDDSTNVTTSYTYDAAGDVLSETKPISVIGPVSATTLYTYDLLGQGLIETDPGDASIPSTRTLSTYDEFGEKTSTTNQVCVPGQSGCTWTSLTSTTTVYDALAHTTRATDTTFESGQSNLVSTTSYAPDLAGDVLSTTTPDGATTGDTYDALGELVSESASGATTTHAYDGLGREVTTVAPGSDTGTLTTTRTFDADGNLLIQSATDSTDSSVSTTTNMYDLLGRTVQSTDPEGQVNTKAYDAAGRVVHSVMGTAASDTTYDRDGKAITFVGPYDSTDQNPTKTTRATAYDGLGRQCRVVDDATFDLQTLTHPCTDPISGTDTTNITTTTYHDAAGDTIATVNDDGSTSASVTRTFYDIGGGVTKTVEGCTNSGTTPPSDPVSCAGTGTQDAETNIITTNTYGASGGLLLSASTVAGVETDTTYDGAGNTLSSVVDVGHLNLTTRYAYDSAGRQISVTDPAGIVTATVYDANGNECRMIANATIDPTSLTNPCTDPIAAKTATANVDTQDSYDAAGNKTDETAPDASVTHDVYDGDGNLTSEITNYVLGYVGIDPSVNATTSYAYDDSGRQITSTDPAGVITATVYDANGNVCRTIGHATIDPMTLTNPCTDPLAGQTASVNIDTGYRYDAAGHKIAMIAPSPADGATPASTVVTDYAYDVASRLCRVVENASPSLDLTSLADPCAGTITSSATANIDTRYSYDANGNLATQYSAGEPSAGDPAGTTHYGFDVLGHQLSQTDPDGNVTSWSYDAGGNKASQSDPDGGKTYWFYDDAARLCRRVAFAPNATYTLPSSPCTSATAVAGAAVDTLYSYDNDGNQTSATDAISGQVIGTTYDALARPTSVSDTGGATTDPGTTYTYGYSTGGRTDASGSYSFTLDTAGRQVSLADPLHSSGNDYAWEYAATGTTTSVTDPTLNATTYSHDALGRLIGQSTGGSSACTTCAYYNYAYNAAGNQISANANISGGSANGTTAYTYDPMSRLLTYTPPTSGANQTYTWNATPDRTSIKTGSASPIMTSYDAASRPVADASDSSDAEGRITELPGSHAGETLTLSWDPASRLTGASSSLGAASSATFTYDPLDRLETILSNGTTTSFLYVGLTDAVAQVTTGSTVTKLVTDLDGTELYDYDATSLAPTYLGRNGHDDVTWTADATGAVNSTAYYDPYGNIVASSGSVPSTRWQGSWQDGASGLYYVVARWYSAASGRFVSNDPITQDQADPQGRDPYAYGAGDATGSTDPDGRDPVLLSNYSVVAGYHEPFFSDPDGNYGLCQSGALRVVLAFTVGAGDPSGTMPIAPRWNTTYVWNQNYGSGYYHGTWPVSSYTDPTTHATAKADKGGDTYGQNYMLYLGYGLKAPGMTGVGLRRSGNIAEDALSMANWETNGEKSGSAQFAMGSGGDTELAVDSNVSMSIDLGVPVWVAIRTASLYRNIGLPSWRVRNVPYGRKLAGKWSTYAKWSDYHSLDEGPLNAGHAIAIVGYDSSNYYYIDTCGQGQFNGAHVSCRAGPYDDYTGFSYRHGASDTSHINHVWKISKDDMHQLMYEWTTKPGVHRWKSAYVYFNGNAICHYPW